MENCRVLIICAGEGTRWNNYLGVPKHLAVLNGEAIIDRTVRQLRERGVEYLVILKDEDDRYPLPQAIVDVDYETNADADKFLSSKKYWNREGRTIILYGDVYFTDEAIDTILNYGSDDWLLFCRPDGSRITGGKWGECFAFSLKAEHLKLFEEKLHYVATLWKTGVIKRCGGWELYRAMIGRTDKQVRHPHKMGSNYVEINDATEDMDSPDDYNAWIKLNSVG